jgi:uncharacterized protein
MKDSRSNLDSKGYIKREVSVNKIKKQFKASFNHTKKEILDKFKLKIHSIYAYGSVLTGKAKSPASDLDILIVLKRKPNERLTNELKNLENQLTKKHIKKYREVGFVVTYKSEVLRSKESFGWTFFIRIICDKISGDNLFGTKTKYKPSKKLALQLHSDVEQDINIAILKIREEKNSKQVKLQQRSILKKIIRTAFSIVMEKEQEWTTDLDYMSEIFIKHYPNKKEEMQKALSWSKKPGADEKETIKFLNIFGKWVVNEFRRKIQ